jgi:hypothetical protein
MCPKCARNVNVPEMCALTSMDVPEMGPNVQECARNRPWTCPKCANDVPEIWPDVHICARVDQERARLAK